MKTRYKYIYFEMIETRPKTIVWGCFNRFNGFKLAEIKWYPRWRQYCFFPQFGTVFNISCLQDIEHFLEQLKNAKKKNGTENKAVQALGTQTGEV